MANAQNPKWYILRDKTPVAVSEFSEFLRWMVRNQSACQVARNQVGKSFVSTIFTGSNYNSVAQGPPLVFESMVFGGPMDLMIKRYSTWDQALKGHNDLIKELTRDHLKSVD